MDKKRVDQIENKKEIPLAEQPKASEIKEIQEEHDSVDKLSEYAPSLAMKKYDRDVAEKLIKAVDAESSELAREIELTKQKSAVLQTINERLQAAELMAEAADFDIDGWTSKLAVLLEIYDSESPYQSLSDKLTEDELQALNQQNGDLASFQGDFSTVKRVVSLVWKSKDHKWRIARAQNMAREAIERQVGNILFGINNEIKSQKPTNDLWFELNNKYRNYCNAKVEATGSAGEDLKRQADSYQKAKADSARLEKMIVFIQPFSQKFRGIFKMAIEDLVDSINRYSKNVASVGTSFQKLQQDYSMATALENKINGIDGMCDRIRNIFSEPNRKGGSVWTEHEMEQWAITKEFLEAIKRFNFLIGRTRKIFGTEAKDFFRSFRQISEAEEISAGRLLTHGAPTEYMYLILERGDLSSVAVQRQKHQTEKRTHRDYTQVNWRPEWDETEIHGVTFNTDSIYENFSSDERETGRGMKIRCDIALVFSENQLLDGRQFVNGMDGTHVYNENYIGNYQRSPGLSLDLRETPFMMLVTAEEYPKLVKFLAEKSAFSGQLSALSPDKKKSWLADHIMVVPKIDDRFKFTPDLKEKFSEATGIKPKKGYLELTRYEAGFKTSSKIKTRQFFTF